ncbi:hypothetical protein KXD40_004220 [Peronospora effusa]|uniref:Uncharacterized protein n=1 Tax=Peronospora effusa TaxID=542832 RepID=A0A3M6VGL9_9STRA|nr:hypothetical protein DD238_006805 [Peronospora effusa]RQM09050.1 hypothetical protein DD237_007017 [Peronospora effusa]UIZ28057.1 hypothetical protein KXD40_004220 [Peronospora effusa]
MNKKELTVVFRKGLSIIGWGETVMDANVQSAKRTCVIEKGKEDERILIDNLAERDLHSRVY